MFKFGRNELFECENANDTVVLINTGIDINMVDVFGYTPLLWAITLKRLCVADILITYHADPNLAKPDLTNPYNHSTVPEMFQLKGCVLLSALNLRPRNISLARKLIRYGANVDSSIFVSESKKFLANERWSHVIAFLMIRRFLYRLIIDNKSLTNRL